MNKKQIKNIINSTKKRAQKITAFLLSIIVLFASSVGVLIIGISNRVTYYLHYNEQSDLDYKVYLYENEYFGEYLGKDQQYIASLIKNIEANFKYDLEIEEQIDYNYYYYIEAETTVKDTNGKNLYEKLDTVVPKKYFENNKDKKLSIDETVNLDYSYYNNLITNFISRYNLTGTTSDVVLKMYVGVDGKCDEYSASLNDDSVISMEIPLTNNTVNIDINYELNNGTDKLIECMNTSYFSNNYYMIASLIAIAGCIDLAFMIYYILSTRNAMTIYNRELKKIFNNYGNYISKIKTEMEYKKFQIILVEDFEDLFEVRNTSGSPILFTQNKNNTKSIFAVPTNSNLVYIYYLSMSTFESVKNEKVKAK